MEIQERQISQKLWGKKFKRGRCLRGYEKKIQEKRMPQKL